MSRRIRDRKGKFALLAAALGALLFVLGPCGNVQYPPSTTNTYGGVAISFG